MGADHYDDSYHISIVDPVDRLYVGTARRTSEGRQALIDAGIWTPEQLALYREQRNRNKNRGSQPSRPKNGDFIAWDGEGVAIKGVHKYVMLCNSRGDSLVNPKGIPTLKALRFISGIADETRGCNHVIYGGSYDANMILNDLSRVSMNELATEGYIWIRDDSMVRYRVEYRPRKYLRITRHIGRVKDCTITMYDVIGFFQTRFVKAVNAWLPDMDTEWLEEMKDNRSTFTLTNKDEIQRYCVLECQTLVSLMEAVRKNAKELGICPTRWDGAGALAAAMLKRNKVRDYIEVPPPAVNRAAQHAYFGGRIELVRFGHTDRPVYSHDIVSAYPSALRELPCMKHGRWEHNSEWSNNGFIMYKIHYESGSINRPFFPFPCRMEDGRVTFPPAVNGWYWAPEVMAAKMLLADDDILSITESWAWVPVCNHQPFGFVQRVSDRRLSMKRTGHMGEKVLKLGLNAIYGKLAQKVGAKNGKPPTYHQLEWAGYITSLTRSRIYQLAMKNPPAVIAFETDGLYSLADHLPDVDSSDKLGEWDKATHAGITYVQSGIYWLRDWLNEGNALDYKPTLVVKPKYRGLDPGTIDEMMVLDAWTRGETELHASSTRFRGLMTSSLSDERYDDWCQWITEAKTIQLQPGGKRIHLRQECDACKWYKPNPHPPSLGLHSTMSVGGNEFSCPHKLPWIDGDSYTVSDDPYYLASTAFDESDEDDLTTWERVR